MNVWPTVTLGTVLAQRKEFITINDTQTYKRPRVQLHAKGIVFRDEVSGSAIKTKKQQVCQAGELLVAEIDAKVGGVGIVSEELAGAIVSSHYFLFVPDTSRLDVRFLGWFIKTPAFRDQVQAQGSTNYAAIRPTDVLEYSMPVPPLEEQRRIVARIELVASTVSAIKQLSMDQSEAAEALIVSTHLDLANGRERQLHQLLRLDEDKAPVSADGSYPQTGIKSFGVGLFAKQPVQGTETTYRVFNRLYEGALVLSQVKGWEGLWQCALPRWLAGSHPPNIGHSAASLARPPRTT